LIPSSFLNKVLASINWGRTFPMAMAHEIRSLIDKTTTGTRRRRVPEEVKEQARHLRGSPVQTGIEPGGDGPGDGPQGS
jgi:hypothetical protein